MKKITFLFVLVLAVIVTSGQEITGEWNGALSVQGMKLRLAFHITKTDAGYSATMDSPDQGAKGIPVTRVSFENPNLRISLENLKAEYSGVLKESSISGTFKQAGMSFPLELTREKLEKKAVIHTQEPKEPFPYYSEEITFSNKKDQISLAGTLTLPAKEGKFPAVVLITGSGPQNRNEELMGHKPFLVLSDYLTRKGIAVLRFDDRGTFGSKGNFKTATTDDFAVDVESAVNYLLTRKEILKRKIGLIGHSEGGIIAPVVAARMKDVRFIVLMAGTAIRGDQLLLLQQELIARASGMSDANIKQSNAINKGAFDLIVQTASNGDMTHALTDYMKETMKSIPASEKPSGMSDDDYIKMALAQLNNPWMLHFLRYNPATTLEKVKCPVLALNGDKDLQVPSKVNLQGIRQSLENGGNRKITIVEFPGLNHLFQECKTGLPAEYAEIEQTISPKVLETIADWILKQTK
jgi:uncharacterized protein